VQACRFFPLRVVLGTPLKSNMLLELVAGLVVISIALTPDLRDWGTLLGPLGTLMSVCGSLASAEVWDPLPQLLYCTVFHLL
jgi:hypothetical protein